MKIAERGQKPAALQWGEAPKNLTTNPKMFALSTGGRCDIILSHSMYGIAWNGCLVVQNAQAGKALSVKNGERVDPKAGKILCKAWGKGYFFVYQEDPQTRFTLSYNKK